jgi:hypothetical protein
MVGTGSDPQRIADQMTAAWLAFARTDDPNGAAIPHRPNNKPLEWATMVFALRSKVMNAERKLLVEIKSRGPLDWSIIRHIKVVLTRLEIGRLAAGVGIGYQCTHEIREAGQ